MQPHSIRIPSLTHVGFRRIRGWAAFWLTAVSHLAVSVASPDVPSSSNQTLELPVVKTGGNVPLRKVGEFHMLQPRSGAAVVAHGKYLYVIGGGNSGDGTLDTVEQIDLETGKSRSFAKLHRGRRWHRAVVVENRIYVLGGTTTFTSNAHTAPSSDPNQGRSTRAQVERYGLPSGQTGAIRASQPDGSVEIIDLETGGVTLGPRLPEPRNEFGCVSVAGRIYVIGGQGVANGKARCTNLVAILDVKSGKWLKGPLLPTARENDAVVVDNNFVIVLGGFDGNRGVANAEVLNVAENNWRVLPNLHKPASASSAAFLGHYIFLFGDYDSPEELIAYDLKSKTSESFTLGYTPARHTSSVTVGNYIYVVGGRVSNAEALDTVQIFELTGSTGTR